MSALHLPKTPWAGTRNDRKGGTFAHTRRRQPPAQSADSSRSPIAIKSRASPQSVLGASWLTCRYGCSTGHQEGEIRRREAATEISSLAVIGLPPSTFSRDRHRRLDTHCAMVGRRNKKRSVSFSLGDCGLPFGAFLFCEACEDSLLHDGDPRSLGRVDGSQLRKAR